MLLSCCPRELLFHVLDMSAMDVREDFWGCILSKEKKTEVWEVPDEDEDIGVDQKLSISQACLGLKAKEGERNVVDVTTEDDDGQERTFTILSMRLGGLEQAHLELGFQNKTTFKLVSGNGPVHLCGVTLQALPEGLTDDSEEEEEETPIKQNAVKVPVKRPSKTAAAEEPPAKKPVVEAQAKPVAEKKTSTKEPEKEEEEDEDDEEEDEEDDESEEESEEEEEEKKAEKPEAVTPKKEVKPAVAAKAQPKKVEEESEEEDDDDDEDDDEDDDADMESDEDEDDEDDDMEDEDDEEDEDDDEEEEESESEEEEKKQQAKKKPMINGHANKGKTKEVTAGAAAQEPKQGKKEKAKVEQKEQPVSKASNKSGKETTTPQKKQVEQKSKGQQKTQTPAKSPAAPTTPKLAKDVNQIKVKLAKSPNLPKSVEKFKNFMKSAHRVTDDEVVKDLWDWLQKNKK